MKILVKISLIVYSFFHKSKLDKYTCPKESPPSKVLAFGLTLTWYIGVIKHTSGGFSGYSTGKLTDNEDISFDFSCTDLTVTENNIDEIKCTVLPFNGTFTGNKKLYVSGINYISNNTLKGTSVTNSVGNPIIFNYDYNPYKRDSNTKSFSIDFNTNITFDIYFTKNATKDLEKNITLFNQNNESHLYNYTLKKNSDKLTGEISEINELLVDSEYSLKISTECGEDETTDLKIKILQMEVNDANFGENSESICKSTLAIVHHFQCN